MPRFALAALLPLLAALGAMAAPASAAYKNCNGFRHGGWSAHTVKEEGYGCDAALGLVRHVIDHGESNLQHTSCSSSFTSRRPNYVRWHCSAYHNGVYTFVSFILER
jgi:hypothetical protein